MSAKVSRCFRVPGEVHARRFENEVVVIHLGEGKYFSLDPIGSTIWDGLAAGKTTEETVAILVAEFDVDDTVAIADVDRLADDLLAAGLLDAST